MGAADAFGVELADVQPSQLYLSETKYRNCLKWFESTGFENYEPLPVKRIGNDLFFTDGHTRAFALWEKGIRTIRAVPEPDDLDWISYLANVQWCRQEGITTIADLAGRVIDSVDYERLWHDRCRDWQNSLAVNPLKDLVIGHETGSGRKQAICNEILRVLPDWFGIEEAIVSYVNDVENMPFIIACLYGKAVGFCAYRIHYRMNAELFVLGVFREFHRMGIGARMIAAVEEVCRSESIPYMSVKTLSERHPDQNYAVTRKFYETQGFKPIEEFPDLWGASNPCLYMIKRVAVQAGSGDGPHEGCRY